MDGWMDGCNVCTFVCILVSMSTCMYVCVCVSVHVCGCVCVRRAGSVDICVYHVFTYTHSVAHVCTCGVVYNMKLYAYVNVHA